MFSRSSRTRSSAVGNRQASVCPACWNLLWLALILSLALPARAQEGTYQAARQAMVQGRTEEAIQGFCALGQYKDAAMMCAQLRAQLAHLNRQNEENFQNGVRAFQAGNYSEAQQYFEQVTGPRYDAAQEYLSKKIPAAIRSGAKPATAAGGAPPQVTQPVATIPFAKDSATRTNKAAERAAKPAALPRPTRTPAVVPPPAKTPPEEVKVEPPPVTAPGADSELAEGIQAYYMANFADAEAKLQQYLDGNGQKRGVANFYVGASKLTRFYLAGAKNEDTRLLAEASNAFKLASKVNGFVPPERYVSPKIVEVYKSSVQ